MQFAAACARFVLLCIQGLLYTLALLIMETVVAYQYGQQPASSMCISETLTNAG